MLQYLEMANHFHSENSNQLKIIVYRFSTCLLVLLRLAHKYKAFQENHILSMFFALLFCGNVLIGAAELYLAIQTNTEGEFDFFGVLNVVNLLVALGVLCIDAFFGLVPNMFYSVYKTGLGKGEDHVTKVYFKANLIIIAVFFVVTLVFNFLGQNYIYITDIILIIEIIYAVLFYLVALRAIFRLEHVKIKRALVKFFIYYLIYAVTQIARCGTLVHSIMHPPDPHHLGGLWGTMVMDALMNAVLTIVIVLFLKDFKLKSKEERSTGTYSGKTMTKDANP